jgi:hypothetical protein
MGLCHPRWTRVIWSMETNAAGGESDDVSNAAVVRACATGAAESKDDGIGGASQLEPHAMGCVEGKGMVKGNEASQKRMRMDN